MPVTHNAFIYVYRGSVNVGDTEVGVQRMGILNNAPDADGVTLSAEEDAHLILIAGKPLGEPIVQYGPFVMNTQEQIQQALADFGSGRFA